MYNKLHTKNNQVLLIILLNILLFLPVLLLLVGVILSKKMHISSIPFIKYLLYAVAAFIPAHLYYKLLMPLHETGHYLTAAFIKKKQHLDADIWMDKKCTSCSKWREYSSKEARLILCAGMLFKFVYCIGIILIFIKMNMKYGMITFVYVMWFEVVLNAFPILQESDGYKVMHIDVFYNEEIKEHNIKEERFVKWIYPWILLVGTIISIKLFSVIDEVPMLLAGFL